jgi:pescadillo
MKKVRRAAGRNEPNEAVRKNSILPEYTLHHLVKERYPRFADALADLDDALTLTFLFATLPGDRVKKVTHKAKQLAASWGAYCATTCAVTKSFISIKGVYMEALINGVPVRWIVPHSFTQFIPQDVDFRIMGTFFEFYDTLLSFVLYKLYNDIGVRYPLRGGTVYEAGSTSSVLAANLKLLTMATKPSSGAISKVVDAAVQKGGSIKAPAKGTVTDEKALNESVGAALNHLPSEDEDEEKDDDDESIDIAGPLKAALETIEAKEGESSFSGTKLDGESLKRKRLFAGLTMFLSREIPRGYLELVCVAFGAKVGWEADDSPISVRGESVFVAWAITHTIFFKMDDPSITHHICDRPQLPKSYSSLPKHREFVQPQWIVDCANNVFLLPISKYAVGQSLPPHLSPWVDHDEEGYKPKYAEEIEKMKNGETISGETEIEPAGQFVEKVADQDEANVDIVAADEEMGDAESDGSEEEDEATSNAKQEKARIKQEEETQRLAKSMMSRKATHLYKRMQNGLSKKQAKVDALHQRRKELDNTVKPEIKGKEKDDAGKTPQKLKVERLKDERKKLGKTYSKVEVVKKAKKRNM